MSGGDHMDFLMINSVNSYVKNINLQNKWQRKKDTNNFITDDKLNEKQRLNEQFKKSYMEQQETSPEDETLSSIYSKIEMGSRLTADEMKYLKCKNPTEYQRIINLENEKKKYERQLKECKTKDDVQKLKFSKVASSLSTINSVKNNPNIPDGKKLEIAAQEHKRMTEMNKIECEFVKSGEYSKLPTQADYNKFRNDIKDAENKEKFEKSDKELIEKDFQTGNSFDKEKNDSIDCKEDANEKPSKIQVEQTPEAKKVRHSKAKSSYIKSISDDIDRSSIIVKA